MRSVTLAATYVFLAICVLLGAAASFLVPVQLALWAALTVALAVGMAAGGLAPRSLASWLAWPAVLSLTWGLYGWAAGAAYLAPRTLVYLTYPLAASAGVGAGLLAWRVVRWRWRIVPIAACAPVVIGLVYLSGPLTRWSAPPPYRAPAFNLPLLSGGRLSSAHLAGSTIVLAFWATWCDPCREELPRLERLYRGRHDDSKFAFYLVDIGGAGETRLKARTFLAKYGIKIPSAYDLDGKLAMKFRTEGVLPARVVIGPRGFVRYQSVGYVPGSGDLQALFATAERTSSGESQ